MLRPVDFRFANEVTVRFAETDAQGVAHHAAYLVWFEVTRIEYLRRFRGGYTGLREEGVDALTLEAYARYSEAARFDDRLTIRARCGDVRGARFRFDYSVERTAPRSRTAGRPTRASRSETTGRRACPAWLAEAIAEAESLAVGAAGGGDSEAAAAGAASSSSRAASAEAASASASSRSGSRAARRE